VHCFTPSRYWAADAAADRHAGPCIAVSGQGCAWWLLLRGAHAQLLEVPTLITRMVIGVSRLMAVYLRDSSSKQQQQQARQCSTG
jgi:hypothetical protein